jgi:hypothetical protein
MDGIVLRDGIFSLRTRRFGTVAEFMIKRLLKCGKAKSLFHDLFDDAKNRRIEVKFSVVMKKAETRLTENTVLQCIENATSAKRMLKFTEWKESKFDSNIQQIKRTEFEVLYYGLFFSDCIKIFRIDSDQIENGQIYYSNKQHKGNVGEGQFHINQDTLGIHLNQYLYKTLSYDELLELLQ